MQLQLGPILYIGACDAGTWRFNVGALVAGAGADDEAQLAGALAMEDAEVHGPFRAGDFTLGGEPRIWWQWQVAVRRETAEQSRSYTLAVPGAEERRVDHVLVPALGSLPRFAFFSCNGVEHKHKVNPASVWKRLLAAHRGTLEDHDHTAGYHLLVGGGDQIYADLLWHRPPLEDYEDLDRRELRDAEVSEEVKRAIRREFVNLYVRRWGVPHLAEPMASIPGAYTWDDHDLRDGWGSHPADIQGSKIYQALFEAARDAFLAFQVGGWGPGVDNRIVGAAPLAVPQHFLQVASFAGEGREMDLVLLDVRSGRTGTEVFSKRQWDEFGAWLDGHADSAENARQRHLLVVSAIPVVHLSYPEFAAPIIHMLDIRDDYIDQWEHPRRKGDRSRLIMRLLEHGPRARCQVTILSGDVHVGAHGLIVSRHPAHLRTDLELPPTQAVINQITSSGIVNVPPSAGELWAMQKAAGSTRDQLTAWTYTDMINVTANALLLAERNWLSCVFDEPHEQQHGRHPRVRLWMQWCTEKLGIQPQVVVEA